jgi:trans-2,3-dihydro-3-hydroxyanthranilate isomerase
MSFATYDVFTAARFSGNPLAVVWDCPDLDAAAMQRIAREFNLSETIFILPPEDPAHTARVRIFTPALEMPFAGHPTVGCAIHLARQRFGEEADIDAVLVLEENVGPVRCAVQLKPGQPAFAQFDSPRLAAQVGAGPDPSLAAQALGLDPTDIGFGRHQPAIWSARAPYVMVPVASPEVLAKIVPGPALVEAVGAAVGVLAFAPLPAAHPHAFRARMFAPGAGVPEDPATGSAAAALAGPLARFEGLSAGRHALPIEQGVEMGRPSLIALEIEVEGGKLTHCRIGGQAVGVMTGQLAL